MYDKQHFTHDAAIASFTEKADGITTDDDGETVINWDDVEQVRIDSPPYTDAFETNKFYRLPATVAKPIRQPYHYGDDSMVWLKKPWEELKKAAWSLDKEPVTLAHPAGKMVKDVDDVHGFWDDTTPVDALEDLDSYAHIPVNDEEAKEYIEENGDVSVGFYNRIARTDEYDGVVGGGDDVDDSDLDGYQTNLLFDHCAFVGRGRCSSEHGCGLDDAPSHGRGHVADNDGGFKYSTAIKDISESDEDHTTDSMKETTDQPEGIYVDDEDNWYGVGPSENPDESPKYDLNNCNDVKDAWNLRGSGDYTIEQSTLEARIKRAADAHDCAEGSRPWVDSATDCADCDDCDCDDTKDTTDNMSFEFEIDDLAPEAAIDRLAEEHEGVNEVIDELGELRDLKETVDSVTDELGFELDELVDEYEEVQEKADAYDEIKQEEKEEDAERLAEMTDKYGDKEEVIEAFDDHEEIKDRIDLLEDAVETTETTTDSGGEEPEGDDIKSYGPKKVPDAWN